MRRSRVVIAILLLGAVISFGTAVWLHLRRSEIRHKAHGRYGATVRDLNEIRWCLLSMPSDERRALLMKSRIRWFGTSLLPLSEVRDKFGECGRGIPEMDAWGHPYLVGDDWGEVVV